MKPSIEYKNEIINCSSELIKIPSYEGLAEEGHPFGKDVSRALNYCLDLCDKLGFKTKNHDNYYGFAEIGQGEEMIGILVHLDVVPEGKDWSVEPYGGLVKDGKLYGRGAIDNKGPAISSIFAMKKLLDDTPNLNKRIRIIFGTNEETGWAGIDKYVSLEEHPTVSIVPDADFPVIHGEKGIIDLTIKNTFTDFVPDQGIKVHSIQGGERSNMVPDFCRAIISSNIEINHILQAYNTEKNSDIKLIENEDGKLTLNSYGKSAHGSTPEEGVNSIGNLLGFLSLIDLQVGDLTNFIRHISHFIGTETDGESLGVKLKDQYGQLTLNLGTIDLDSEKGNVKINIRSPLTLSMDDVISKISDEFNHFGLEVETTSTAKPKFIPEDDPLIETLMSVYKKHTGDDSKPFTIGGGTYARAFDKAVAFGPLLPGTPELAHQKDEYISVDDLTLIADIYYDALKELLK